MPSAISTIWPPEGTAVGAFTAEQWNGLAATGPFVDHRFLAALEKTSCVGSSTGWQALPLSSNDRKGTLRAAAPAYLKNHSFGEFVFDWAWAKAASSIGQAWYPKLLIAAPFTPVSGPRLLGARTDPAAAVELIAQAEALVERHRLSSAGVNFCDLTDARLLRQAGWLARFDWQFHWANRGYRDFEDFLSTLKRKPRKNIRAERRRVAAAGWRFDWKSGRQTTQDDLDLIDRCQRATFALYGNRAPLNRGFFERCAGAFADNFLVCIARRNAQALAVAVFWRDHRRLYGRYWGCLEDARDLHFETCYYQGIDYCISRGLEVFEPGAQGEHKIRRGFLPRHTRSFHYIRDPRLRAGIARYLKAEKQALVDYRQHLNRLNPYDQGALK